jgi:hypothetical protein
MPVTFISTELLPMRFIDSDRRSISPTLLGELKRQVMLPIGTPMPSSTWKRAKSMPRPWLNQSSTSSLNSTKYCG